MSETRTDKEFWATRPPKGIGIDSFEFWTPDRRPKGKNLALTLEKPLTIFEAENLQNSGLQPFSDGTTNAWVAAMDDETPVVTLNWEKPTSIKTIKLFFDRDYDHALESTLMGHPEDTIPFIIKEYLVKDDKGNVLKKVTDNYLAINNHTFEIDVFTKTLTFEFCKSYETIPVSVFNISAF